MNGRLLLLGFVSLLLFGGGPLPAQTEASQARLNDIAALLAGMVPTGSPDILAIAKSPEWQKFAQDFERLYSTRTAPQLEKVSQWAHAELGTFATNAEPVFYFFSGPDFLYPATIFPGSASYVLCAKEPVGFVPDPATLPPAELSAGLLNLEQSLDTILSYTYFITEDMKTDLGSSAFTGVLPVLYVFLARTGKTILDVENVSLDQAGNLASGTGGPVSGVRIRFRSAEQAGVQTLYYFSTDISNGGAGAAGGLFRFCAALGDGKSFFKSASYLPHYDNFSRVTDFVLGHSNVIVQDDSGIPLKDFDRAKWTVRVFGNYVGPLEIFEKFYQSDLAELYRVSNPKPVDFGMGYRFQPDQTALLVAFRK